MPHLLMFGSRAATQATIAGEAALGRARRSEKKGEKKKKKESEFEKERRQIGPSYRKEILFVKSFIWVKPSMHLNLVY